MAARAPDLPDRPSAVGQANLPFSIIDKAQALSRPTLD